MTDIEKLRGEYEAAEAKALKLQADKDEAMQKVLDRFRDRQREANQDTATAQKALADAEASQALADRDDLSDAEKLALAANLGLTLPE
jgi:membrane-bound lytic murein transglycosylase B